MGLWWKGPNVTKPFIGGNEELTVSLDCLPERVVLPPAHVLFHNAAGVVAVVA